VRLGIERFDSSDSGQAPFDDRSRHRDAVTLLEKEWSGEGLGDGLDDDEEGDGGEDDEG
jgi:hypothetical protein